MIKKILFIPFLSMITMACTSSFHAKILSEDSDNQDSINAEATATPASTPTPVNSASPTPDTLTTSELYQINSSPFGIHPASVPGISDPYQYANELQIAWDRLSLYIYWQKVLNDKGDFDWTEYDQILQTTPTNIQVMINIATCLPAAANTPCSLTKDNSYEPKDPSAYKKFISSLVARYGKLGVVKNLKQPVKVWQIDNEPSTKKGSGYESLLKISYEAIKKADSSAWVVIGGVTGFPPASTYIQNYKTEYPYLKNLAGKYFDVLDVHWYGNGTGDYKGLKDVINELKNDLGCEKQIWTTETGTYSGSPKPFSFLPNMTFSSQTEEDQAKDIVRRYVYYSANGIKKIFWAFGMVEGFQNDQGYFDYTGLIYKNEQKKKAFYALKKLIELTSSMNWQNIKTICEGTKTSVCLDKLYIYELSSTANKNVWIIWRDTYDSSNSELFTFHTGNTKIKLTSLIPTQSDNSITYPGTILEPNQEAVTFLVDTKPIILEPQ